MNTAMGTVPDDAADFFSGSPTGLAIFLAITKAVRAVGEDVTIRITKSQIAFRRRSGFAYVWRPGRYLRSEVPAVLSIPLHRCVNSARFKEVAHPSPGIWMHHIEMHTDTEVNSEVRDWLSEAYDDAG
ncbi:DUF5655 domain-containing protein [Gordonia sp. NPDC127522]|uniref:DUF5655 domain-containing protein n=1 Tax=Gordonia sp. NPDC127522 TaxID=3345390 RepID=UPI0036400B26